MMLSIEQAKQWNDESIAYLKGMEYEWVTVRITSENEVHIYPDSHVSDIESESEDDITMELRGWEILDYRDRAQFILHNS
jgi:hypothetical protein